MADRLAEARARGFVGRREEVEAFRELLAAGHGMVIHVHGSAGIGKSTLLHQFARIAEQAGRPVVHLGADGAEPPAGPAADPGDPLHAAPGTLVVIDRPDPVPVAERLLSALPDDAVLVLADREPPPLSWRTDPAWHGLLHTVHLRPLAPEDSAELLSRRGVPEAEHLPIIGFTHGHPLALALMADVHGHSTAHGHGDPAQPPRVVSALVAALLDAVPGPLHRAALEAYSQVLVTTEPLLAVLLDVPDAGALFEWLCTLSITEYGGRGIHPHDLARSVLDAELGWRHPARRTTLRRRAGTYYQQLFLDGDRPRQRTVLADFAYLHRDSPMVGPLLTPVASGAAGHARLDALAIAPAQEADLPALLALAERHEGGESARLLGRWWDHPAATWATIRTGTPAPARPGADSGPAAEAAAEPPAGFYVLLALRPDAYADPVTTADPAAAAAVAWLGGEGELRAGEYALLLRAWLDRDAYQGVSAVQTLLTLQLTHHYLAGESRPALTLLPFADPGFWADGLAYTDFARLPEADFTIGDRTHGVFVHDWRRTPPLAWLSLLGERESATDPLAVAPPSPGRRRILDAESFASGVREALRSLGRVGGLRANPLLASRMVAARAGETASQDERAAALAEVLREAAGELQAAPHDRRAHRALHHTHFQPVGTQQGAADLLNLPLSTYRRHLAAGVRRLTEELWRRELDA
ncbi:AAA family ATPase [Streptomyces sp. NPDC059104]|uniref:AAA family ATPase n=1 Tax=Streptomyces sp. NPDC059104 TaxID=3346729 RepID=UPI0036BC8D77